MSACGSPLSSNRRMEPAVAVNANVRPGSSSVCLVVESGGRRCCSAADGVEVFGRRARWDCPSGRPALSPRGATADCRPKRSPSRHRQTEPAQERRGAAQSNQIASSLPRPGSTFVPATLGAHEACLPRRANDLADNRGTPNLPRPVVFTSRLSAAAPVRKRCLRSQSFRRANGCLKSV